MDLIIRRAEIDEMPVAMELLREAAVWLRDKSVDYWQDWHMPPPMFVEWIASGFRRGEFYFVYDGDVLVGMYQLQYADEMFWGVRRDRAGYLHSFTTKREFAGRGIGAAMLARISAQLAGEGVEFLRLDCSPEIAGLCRYYEANGCVARGDVLTELTVPGVVVRLYEKRVGKA